jgi:hypothetical protein
MTKIKKINKFRLKDEIEKKNKKLTKGSRKKITNQKSEDKYTNTRNQGDHPEILNGQCEFQRRREKKKLSATFHQEPTNSRHL